jgi:hypothetical protein
VTRTFYDYAVDTSYGTLLAGGVGVKGKGWCPRAGTRSVTSTG